MGIVGGTIDTTGLDLGRCIHMRRLRTLGGGGIREEVGMSCYESFPSSLSSITFATVGPWTGILVPWNPSG